MAIGNDNVSHIVLECVQCKQNFTELKDSDLHVKETHHRINARFQCPKCEKYFGNYQIMQLHLRVHDSDVQKSDICPTSEINMSEQLSKSNEVNEKVCSEEIIKTPNLDYRKPNCSQAKKTVGLTKIRLEDCLRCDACSCIYIDESDYKKHMKNFHRTNSNRKPKQKKGCRSCCKQCNCQGNHPSPTVQNERGNNNLFRVNIKDRWTKMVSCRLNNQESKCDESAIKTEIKPDPDTVSGMPSLIDYSDLLSQVEVKIKTEPVDDIEDSGFYE
ncbi:hypothetical protein R5R35_006435 [Gryllus longicercus]|uniref:C2H2-type domain-containing protein n=1 Tax=Gryllus longicercus TaxID=2509291 RepID=A0AAN9VUU2_9ORTH